MKIAIISDIHGNLEALKATLEDIEENLEAESYSFELSQGKYRDMEKVNQNFKRLGINPDKI